MREILLDTETTGGNIKDGDRAIDIGLVEMVDGKRTGRTWQTYLNPEGRKSHWGALRVHGIKDSFLLDKPLFKDVADDMMTFIDGAPCLAHGARFDRDVIIAEFYRSELQIPDLKFYDTVKMAKRCIGGKKHSLDALVQMLDITTPDRKVHGALLDSDILGMVLEQLHEQFPDKFDADLRHTSPLGALPTFLQGTVHDPRTTHPAVLTMPGTRPFQEPEKVSNAPQDGTLNPGVQGKIDKINATDGPVDRKISRLLRTGGNDGFSRLEADEAMDQAEKLYPRADILKAFEDVGLGSERDIRARAKGLRWMCRGVRPDRWAACRLTTSANPNKDRTVEDVEPRKPRRAPGELNPGVQEKIDAINATTGDVGQRIYQLMRSGGADGYSRYKSEDALHHAEKNFPKQDIVDAFDSVDGRVDVAGLRWMARGLRPDRWAACQMVALEMRQYQQRAAEAPAAEPAQDVDDTPGMDM